MSVEFAVFVLSAVLHGLVNGILTNMVLPDLANYLRELSPKALGLLRL